MKLAWYTPYSHRSAIGTFSREVIGSLIERGHQTTIIRSEGPGTDALQSCQPSAGEVLEARDIDDNLERFLSEFDMVLYNVGNHLPNHYWCLEHAQRVPGITILHDYLLHHLLSEWCCQPERPTYMEVLKCEAGEQAVQQYLAALDGDPHRDWFMSRAAEYPVLRFALKRSLGVVAHAKFYTQLCCDRLNCPVTTIPLAFAMQPSQPPPSSPNSAGKMQLITVGDVNANKRYESVIRAIGGSRELSSKWQYRLAGAVNKNYEQHLRAVARDCEFPVDLSVLGSVDEPTLYRELDQAHAIACLRYPFIEGASASVIVSLASGRPTLVSDGGCYAEIPDEYIFRVEHHCEDASLRRHLTNMANDYPAAAHKAIRASHWAHQQYSGRNYANQLLPFIDTIIDSRPLLNLADSVARQLAAWHCPATAPVINQLSAAASELFGHRQRAG